MAELAPDEGLDVILQQFPGNATRLTTLYCGLFTSQSASTVITSGQTMANITEPGTGAYARQAIANSSWGAPAVGTGGRKVTAGQVTFPTVTSGTATINGFFISDASSAGKVIYAANFDDGLAVTVATGDIVRVTPSYTLQN